MISEKLGAQQAEGAQSRRAPQESDQIYHRFISLFSPALMLANPLLLNFFHSFSDRKSPRFESGLQLSPISKKYISVNMSTISGRGDVRSQKKTEKTREKGSTIRIGSGPTPAARGKRRG